ncbi:hypothetical protein GCM10010443_87320 [Actinoplanes cyaneus]
MTREGAAHCRGEPHADIGPTGYSFDDHHRKGVDGAGAMPAVAPPFTGSPRSRHTTRTCEPGRLTACVSVDRHGLPGRLLPPGVNRATTYVPEAGFDLGSELGKGITGRRAARLP